jgi:hypothetical protein
MGKLQSFCLLQMHSSPPISHAPTALRFLHLQYQYFQDNTDVAVFRVGPLDLSASNANGLVGGLVAVTVNILPSCLTAS